MKTDFFKKINIYHRVYNPESPLKLALPLVCLHGLMGYSSNWGKIWPYFQKERPVLVLDQRGHGKSDKPPSGYAPLDYAEDLHTLIHELGWDRVHLVGHSMGGRVAMYFAKEYPNHLASLILEDSGAEARPDRLRWIQNLLNKIPTPFATRESAKHFFDVQFADDPLTGGFIHSNLVRQEDGSYNWRFLPAAMVETIQLGRALDAMEVFRNLTIPTLIIRGELSAEFTQNEAERMQRARAGVELAVVKGSGHFVHPTHPEEFSKLLHEFIVRHE